MRILILFRHQKTKEASSSSSSWRRRN